MSTKPTLGVVTQIAVKDLTPDPHQPRKTYGKEALDKFAADLKQHGVIQALTIRNHAELGLVIVHGERRWRASKIAGLKTVPCVLVESQDAIGRGVLQVQENLHREDLQPLDLAEFLDGLRKTENKTDNELVKALQDKGLKEAGFLKVSQLLELVKLPQWAKDYMRAGKISETAAHKLVQLVQWPAMLPGAKQEIDEQLRWRGSFTAKDAKDIVSDAIRREGIDLDSTYDGNEPENVRKFDLSICKGCEFKVQSRGTTWCVNPAEFHKKNKDALRIAAEEEKERERLQAAAQKGQSKSGKPPTKAEQAVLASKSKRKTELKFEKIEEYLDAWLRKKLFTIPEALPAGRMHALALWMACGAPCHTPPGGFHYGFYTRHEEANKQTAVLLREYKLGDLPTFLSLPEKIEDQLWRDMAGRAILTMDEGQLRAFAHWLKLDLLEAGYQVDEDYLNLLRSTDLLKLAKIAELPDARGAMKELKRKLLAPASVKKLAVPADLQKVYDKTPEAKGLKAIDVDLSSLVPPPSKEETAALGAAATAAAKKKAKKAPAKSNGKKSK